MEAERGRLGDQNDGVGPAQRRDDRAGRPGRRVEDGGPWAPQTRLDRSDEWRSRGHAHIEPALDQLDVVRFQDLHGPDAPTRFADGMPGADLGAAAAAVAELGEDEGLRTERHDGVVLAKLSALPAAIAKGCLHPGSRNRDVFSAAHGAL